MDSGYNDGAQERTRTFTAVKPLAPEASASTNSATWARPIGSREPASIKVRSRSVNAGSEARPRGRLRRGAASSIRRAADSVFTTAIDRPSMQNLVTIFGGSGFIGTQAMRQLAKAGWRIRVAVRQPNLGYAMRLHGDVGQIDVV